ncbi:histidinol-phosphatase (PHP family) [Cetobacterium ceti]|uniref:Histidinol-phosphatase n=1 Tax=Cetobacterium ceti TaxID=180163 RepID=A0A1T4L9T5_9FUSO|nr:histidinol-phosphatase HisJ family protein [Cetobacterium ceti]SJZ51515.1 histidinol-phosphatase (PHP family) [Cetobacterium ceti]
MLISDYHVHSEFSGDSIEKLESIIKRAKELGLQEIAITDHYDYDMKANHEDFIVDLKNYVPKILELKDMNKKELDIKLGIEFGMQGHLGDHARKILNAYPFDYVLSSVHSIETIDISLPEYFKGKTPLEAHRRYFESVLENINTYDDFSVCSHLDFVTRYGGSDYRHMDYKKNWDLIEAILKKLISMNRGIEINTSGFRYGENRFYPCEDIVKEYYRLGGEILTIGSDAHRAEHIAMDFSKVYDFLESIGVKYISSFNKREVTFKKLK